MIKEATKYYVSSMCIDLHRWQRSLKVSCALVFIRFVWHLQVQLSQPIIDKFSASSTAKYFDLSSLSLLKHTKTSQMSCNILVLSINALIILLFLTNMIYFTLKKSPLLIKQSFSVLVQTYNYICFVPFLVIASPFADFQTIGLANFLLTITISFTICIHNQNHSFITRDFLSKRTKTEIQALALFLESLPALAYRYDALPDITFILCLCANIVGIIEASTMKSVQKDQTRFFLLVCYVFQTSVVISLGVCNAHTIYLQYFPLFVLFFLPLSVKVSNTVIWRQARQIQTNIGDLDNIKVSQTGDIENFLRLMLFNIGGATFSEYQFNEYSILFEDLLVQHQLSCERVDCVFCSNKNCTAEELRLTFIAGNERLYFLHSFISEQFRRIITLSAQQNHFKDTGLFLSYISYLFEIKKQKILSFVEIMRLKPVIRLSLREESLLSEIIAVSQLEQPNQEDSSVNSAEKPYMFMIRFDENLNRIEQLYIETLQKKLCVLNIIGKNHINLQEFQSEATALVKQIDRVCRGLVQLGKINYLNEKVQYYMDGFILNLSFGDQKRLLFRKPKHLKSKYKQKKLRRVHEDTQVVVENQNPFEADTLIQSGGQCIVFLSLQESKIGEIQRVSNNFTSLFRYPRSKVIGQNINTIIPALIAKEHNTLISRFLTKSVNGGDCSYQRENGLDQSTDELDDDLIRYESASSFRMLLAKDKNGWGVPVSMELNIECDGIKYCGVVARLKLLPTEVSYIMSNVKDLQIQLMTEGLFKALFHESDITQNDVTKMYMNKIIPLLCCLNKRESVGFLNKNVIKTIAFIPKKKKEKKGTVSSRIEDHFMKTQTIYKKSSGDAQSIERDLESYRLDSFDVYFLKFERHSFCSSVVKSVKYHIFQVNQVKKLVDAKEILRSLCYFKSQLLDYLQVAFDEQKFFLSSENTLETDKDMMMLSTKEYLLTTECRLSARKSMRFNLESNGELITESILQSHDEVSSPPLSPMNSANLLKKQKTALTLENVQLNRTFDKQESNVKQISSCVSTALENSHQPRKMTIKSLSVNENTIQKLVQQQQQSHKLLLQREKSMSKEPAKFIGSPQHSNFSHFSSQFLSDNNHKLDDPFSESKSFSNERKSRINQGASSIISSANQTGVVRNYIYLLFRQKKRDVSFLLLQFFGFTAICIISLLTLINFDRITTNLENARSDIALIPWGNNLRHAFAAGFNYYRLSELLYYNAFNDITLKNDTFIALIRQQSWDQITMMRDEFQKLQQSFDIDRRSYFEYANNAMMDYIINYDDATTPAAYRYLNISTYKYTVKMPMQYMLINTLYTLYGFVKEVTFDTQTVYYEKQYNDNFPMMQLNITRVQTMTVNQSISLLDDTEDKADDFMVVVFITAFALIIFILPLYYFIQYTNQGVLKLFATIPPQALDVMIERLNVSIELPFDDLNPNLKHFHKAKTQNGAVLARGISHGKKAKTLSTTSQLPKFKPFIGLICLVAYSMCIIHPTISFVLVRNFNDEVQENIDLLGALSTLRAQISNNVTANFQFLKNLLVTQKKIYNSVYFLARLKATTTSNGSVYEDIVRIVDSSYGVPKRQQDEYDNFFFKILGGNICEAIEEYPQYVTSSNAIDHDTCVSTNDGILKQGFQVATKKFFGMVADLYAINQLASTSEKKAAALRWQKTSPIMDAYYLNEALSKLSMIIKDFFLIIMDSDISNIVDTSRLLLIYQILLLMVAFAYGWYQFIEYVKLEMRDIKATLQVLSIEFVIDNPYIMSYLRK